MALRSARSAALSYSIMPRPPYHQCGLWGRGRPDNVHYRSRKRSNPLRAYADCGQGNVFSSSVRGKPAARIPRGAFAPLVSVSAKSLLVRSLADRADPIRPESGDSVPHSAGTKRVRVLPFVRKGLSCFARIDDGLSHRQRKALHFANVVCVDLDFRAVVDNLAIRLFDGFEQYGHVRATGIEHDHRGGLLVSARPDCRSPATRDRNAAGRRYRDNRRHNAKIEYRYKGCCRTLAIDLVNRFLIKSRGLEQSISQTFLVQRPIEVRERKPPQVDILEVRRKIRSGPGTLAGDPTQLPDVKLSGRDDIADNGYPHRHPPVLAEQSLATPPSPLPASRGRDRPIYGAEVKPTLFDFSPAASGSATTIHRLIGFSLYQLQYAPRTQASVSVISRRVGCGDKIS